MEKKAKRTSREKEIVGELTRAIYPILYPVEQQDYARQMRNFKRVEKAAWSAYIAWVLETQD